MGTVRSSGSLSLTRNSKSKVFFWLDFIAVSSVAPEVSSAKSELNKSCELNRRSQPLSLKSFRNQISLLQPAPAERATAARPTQLAPPLPGLHPALAAAVRSSRNVSARLQRSAEELQRRASRRAALPAESRSRRAGESAGAAKVCPGPAAGGWARRLGGCRAEDRPTWPGWPSREGLWQGARKVAKDAQGRERGRGSA